MVESAMQGMNKLHQLGRIAGMQEAVQILQEERMHEAASVVSRKCRRLIQEMDK